VATSLRLLTVLLAIVATSCGSTSETVTGPTPVKCGVQVQLEQTTFTASGGTGTLKVTSNRECTWTAQSDAGWVSLTSTSGQGDATMRVTVAANDSPAARSAGITIKDQHVQITQAAGDCELRLSATRVSMAPAGEERTIQVTANGAQCAWTARSNASWITIAAGTSGTGSGSVELRAAPASEASRTGTVTIAGQTVTVVQSRTPQPDCGVSVNPAALTIPTSGGERTISVAAPAGCEWSAESDVPWIVLNAGATGSGPGEVRVTVAASSGPGRTATVRIGEQVVTVTQGSGCAATIDPTTVNVEAAGGTRSVRVAAGGGCEWAATPAAGWIRVTAGARGNGAGRVDLAIDANSGPARSGSVAIAGHALTVSQAAGCTYSVAPSRRDVPGGGGTAAFALTTGAGCPWTISTDEQWLSVPATSGTGPAQVQITASANLGPARTASVGIGGQVVTIAQATGCAYSVAPASQSLPGAGGGGSVSVTTSAGCPWSLSGGASWLSVATTSGNGSAQIALSAAANLGPSRRATLAIAGRTAGVSQPSACTYSFMPASHKFDAAGGNGNVLVFASGPCTWTAVSTVDWIRITAGSPSTGGNLLQFKAAPNTGPARTGIIKVAEQDYVVTESAAQ
jgi:hypothetical protein